MRAPVGPTPMFPLSTVLFPRAPLVLHVFEERYRAMVADCLAAERGFGVVLISRGSDVGGGDERMRVGTLADIEIARPLAEGRWALLARGTRRIEVVSWIGETPYPQAHVEELGEESGEAVAAPSQSSLDAAGMAVSRARALLSELGEDLPAWLAVDDEIAPDQRVWSLCASAPLPESDRQLVLEAEDHEARLDLLARLCGELADDVAGYLRRRS